MENENLIRNAEGLCIPVEKGEPIYFTYVFVCFSSRWDCVLELINKNIADCDYVISISVCILYTMSLK